MKNILLIPRIQIHNANALSSPYTIGFPAMTAWLGAVHALQRQLKNQNEDFENLVFKSLGIVCHDIDLQTYKGKSDFVSSIVGTGNPLDKSGSRPSFIEEARCHLTISLVIEYDFRGGNKDDLKEAVDIFIKGKLKFAGGDVLTAKPSETHQTKDSNAEKQLLNRLMPSFCLIERRDLIQTAMEEGQDALEALLGYLTVHHTYKENEKTWKSSRKTKGWIVPIATGFQGISDLGIAENQRDEDTPHRFAESIVTLGEFIMPYRLENLDSMLWHTYADLENNLYLCQQNTPYQPN